MHTLAEEQAVQLAEHAVQVVLLARKNPALQVSHALAVGQVEQLAMEQLTAAVAQAPLVQV